MPDLDELLADIEDAEVAEAIKGAFQEKDAQVAKERALLDRDRRVEQKKADLAAKFPRSMHVFTKGKLQLPDDPSDEALVAFLKEKEAEYEDIGVVVPSEKPKAEPANEEPAGDDPAEVWGRDIGTGHIEQSAISAYDRLEEIANSGEYGTSAEFIGAVKDIYDSGKNYDQIDAWVEAHHPKYPVGRGPAGRLTELIPLAGAGKNKPKKGKSNK